MRWRAAVPVSCSSVKFSPFFENRIAVTTSQNFGIVGNGGLHVLEVRVPEETRNSLCVRHALTLAGDGFARKWGGLPDDFLSFATQTSPQGIRPLVAYETLDGLYDCAWSEENENVVAAACGDGSVKVYDIAQPPQANPLRSFHEHQHEVRTSALVVCHTQRARCCCCCPAPAKLLKIC